MKKKGKKKNKKWIRLRHRVITAVAGVFFYPVCVLRYGVRIRRFREQGDRHYLVVMNHQTAFDQFFVSLSFRKPVYYLASEDIFSLGFLSKLLRYAVAPIPIKKQTSDIQAVYTCIRVAREGGTVALAPEGNRTYSGKTGYMKPSIVKLVRALKVPLAIYRIEGGYGVHPRWSDVVRRGKMTAGVTRVVEPEEYKTLSDEELLSMIKDELYVNEAKIDGTYRHKRLAEYLERAIYVCPSCGLSRFVSEGDVITCTKCARKVRYLPTKELQGIGFEFPFRFVDQWYEYQCETINALDPSEYISQPVFRDKADFREVILYQNKQLLRKNAAVALYGDRISIDDELVFPFDSTEAITVLGKNKVNIYFGEKVYQLKGDKRFNALKYVNIFHRHKNISEGNAYGKFLGL